MRSRARPGRAPPPSALPVRARAGRPCTGSKPPVLPGPASGKVRPPASSTIPRRGAAGSEGGATHALAGPLVHPRRRWLRPSQAQQKPGIAAVRLRLRAAGLVDQAPQSLPVVLFPPGCRVGPRRCARLRRRARPRPACGRSWLQCADARRAGGARSRSAPRPSRSPLRRRRRRRGPFSIQATVEGSRARSRAPLRCRRAVLLSPCERDARAAPSRASAFMPGASSASDAARRKCSLASPGLFPPAAQRSQARAPARARPSKRSASARYNLCATAGWPAASAAAMQPRDCSAAPARSPASGSPRAAPSRPQGRTELRPAPRHDGRPPGATRRHARPGAAPNRTEADISRSMS